MEIEAARERITVLENSEASLRTQIGCLHEQLLCSSDSECASTGAPKPEFDTEYGAMLTMVELDQSERNHSAGLWTEIDRSKEHVEYMPAEAYSRISEREPMEI